MAEQQAQWLTQLMRLTQSDTQVTGLLMSPSVAEIKVVFCLDRKAHNHN